MNTLAGLSFGNSLVGRGGDDLLLGGEGQDLLQGDAGADRFEGGLQNDQLSGGADADTFVFGAIGDFGDTITDFDSGTGSSSVDRLQFTMATIPIGDRDAVVDSFVHFGSGPITNGTEIVARLDNGLNEGQIVNFVNTTMGSVTNGILFLSKMDETQKVAIWYDDNPSAAGGTVKVAENLALNGNYDASRFLVRVGRRGSH